MAKAARHRLAQLLAGTEPAGSDSAMVRLPGDALELEVADVGSVALPMRAAQAKRLISVARPARFGRGEETLSDISVRDTWELTPDQVSLGGSRWQAHLDAALEHIADELRLPAGSRLRAELHSMLVYAKGQFFLPHQDSEKHDDMIATLVVSLPSVHTGGELVVDDGGNEQTYRGSSDDLVLVGFYADRRHEVRPVRSGYRVTLTFNVMLTTPPQTTESRPVATAARCLTEHFATPATSEYGERELGPPTRLVFLLDHEYTQRGLASRRLKGTDAERVATLRAAAAAADCDCLLALADIKETWDAFPTDDHWYPDDEYDDAADPDDDSGYELNSLIDDEMILGWWTNFDGSGAETISLPLGRHEVCAVTPTKTLTPYETEYEGYMGNYGNTMDRWYRRAAVVVWPTKKSFAARAEAGSAWAMRRLLDLIDAGDFDSARADALSLEPFWLHVEPDLLTPSLRVAVGLRDTESARVVLAPFRLEMLTADHSPLLAAAAVEYGHPWLTELIDNWDAARRFGGAERRDWVVEALLPLCRTLRDEGAPQLADHVGERVWRWLSTRIEAGINHDHPERRRAELTELGAPLVRLLEAASEEVGARIAETLRACEDTVVELLVPALQAHQTPPPTPALAAVAEECRTRLTRLTDRPARAEDDWSIDWTGCGCDLCDRLATFLTSRTDRTDAWPLAKPGRQHIHQQIDNAGLPVRHATRRHGRPYTLLLEKTDDLFRRELEQRRQAVADLTWLTSTFT